MRKLLLIGLATFLVLSSPFSASASLIIPHPVARDFDPELARSAFLALKNLPRKERMTKLKMARRELRDFRVAKKAGKDPDTNTLLLVLLDILLPPLAVYLHEGETNSKFWITLLLFVLGLAGVFLFSWLLIFAAIVYGLIVILGS